MKPPVPLNAPLAAAILALGVVAALLPIGGPPEEPAPAPAAAPASTAETPAEPGPHERDYLLRYAEVICLRAAYGALVPAPSQVLEALDSEAFTMVELSHQPAAVYRSIHKKAWAAGGGQTAARAIAGCDAWVDAAAGGILKIAADGG